MIHLICALKCESQPVIDRFRMTRHGHQTVFDTYINRDENISLTLSGIGKTSAAAAVTHAYMLMKDKNCDGWLNFGIAGHGYHMPGTAILANKVIDDASGKVWYPQLLFDIDYNNGPVITLDKPSCDYQENSVFDMEAAGFFEAVTRFSPLDVCHSLKVISDNNARHLLQINKSSAADLIDQNIDKIINLVEDISSFTDAVEPAPFSKELYLDLITRHHFSHTQKLQLIKLLRRWKVLQHDNALRPVQLIKYKNSNEILAYLSKMLNDMPYIL